MKAEDSGNLEAVWVCVGIAVKREQTLDSKCSDMTETCLDRWGDKHDDFESGVSIKVETYLFD